MILFSFLYVCSQSGLSFLLHAQAQRSNQSVVAIPKGSANSEVDITNLTPRQWYDPREITVGINDTIIWTNNDTEPHTVTSGAGGGLDSLMSNSKGKPDGIFDSGLFGPNNTTLIKFNQSGVYH